MPPKEPGGLGRDLDVGKVLQFRKSELIQQVSAQRGIIRPVVTVRRLGRVDIPVAGWVARIDDFVHELERARHHRATGFSRIEELLLVNLLATVCAG